MPLDFFDECGAAFHMSPSPGAGLPAAATEVHGAATTALLRNSPGAVLKPLERFAFYERAKKAFAVVQASGERRPYGCFILAKGVIGPDGRDLKP